MKLKSENGIIEDLERWMRAYSAYIASLSYAPNTISLYTKIIENFIEYMRSYDEEVELDTMSPIHFTGFLFYVNELAIKRGKKMGLGKASKVTYLKAIKSFFDFIESTNNEQQVFSNLFKRINVTDSSRPEEKMKHIEEDDLTKILNQLEKNKSAKQNKKGYFLAIRNALLVKLLVYSGLRASEALELRVKDFVENESMFVIRVFGKGQKVQTAYCPVEAIYDEFISIVEEKKLKEDDFLFLTPSMKRLDRHNAYRAVAKIYKQAGVNKTGLHILRHTLAMRLIRNNASLSTIQSILRHSSITTTGIYAKADERDKKESLKKIWNADKPQQ